MLAELRHLVQEAHPAVRQADTCPTVGAGSARPRPLPAAGQACVRVCMPARVSVFSFSVHAPIFQSETLKGRIIIAVECN